MAQKKMDSVQFIKDKIDEGENWYVIRQVQINRSFYNSQQWISYDRVNRRVFVPELRPGEKRLTFNKIKPAVLTLLSKLSKNRVKLEVKPDTNDVNRIEIAKAGLKYLTYQWDEDKMDTKSRRLKFHMIVDGFPTLKVYVDKTKGDDLAVDEESAEAAGIEEPPQKAGKICTQVCDQFVILVDPNAESLEEIYWAMERRPEDVDEIKELWGVTVAPDDNITMRQSFEMGLVTPTAMGLDIKKFKHHAIVNDYWEMPCTKYPNGRRIVTAGDKELYKSDDPGEFPFIFFPAVPVPGTAIATGVVTDMTTPQRSYNIKKTAEARILEEMGNPMWINPNGGTDDDELTNEIGGIVHATGEALPQRVAGVEPGNAWQAAMDRDEADLEDISGAHEITQGSAQKGNPTLGGLQLQVEQDETKLALLVQSYEDGIKIWGEKVLRLVQKHFPEEQQLSIVGENGEIEAFTFAGADLTGGEVVDVIPGSSMPTLKAVQDEKVMAMWSAGMFNNPSTGQPDTRKVVRMLGESIATQYFDDSEQDENKALMEQRSWQQSFDDPKIAKALMGYSMQMQQYQAAQQEAQALAAEMQQQGIQAPPVQLQPPQPPVKLPIVRDFYDHEAHIMVHNRFRKGDEYDQLPPEFQGIIDQHVKEHEQYLMAPQMQAQQQMQQQVAQQNQAQQEQTQAQAQEADKQRKHDQATKMQDHYNRMDETALKGNIALQTAAAKGGALQ